MTKSEEITSMISKKFFLNQYIYSDVFVKKESQEQEFCDCLVEFGSCYIVIQIKERSDKAQTSAEKWFEKKVLKVAKGQIKDTFDFYRDQTNFIFSKSSDLSIDRDRILIPVIVFVNNDLECYDRIVYSSSLDTDINIFSFGDFKKMLETIVIPYDILSYLYYRTVFKNNRPMVVFDEIDNNTTVMGTPVNEEDYAYLFLAKSYYKDISERKIAEENIARYNYLISELNTARGCLRDSFISGLLRVDYVRADSIGRNYGKLIELAQKEKYVEPYKVFLDDTVYLFLVHPNTVNWDDLLCTLELSMIYCQYKNKCKFAHVIMFRKEVEDKITVELADFDFSALRYDEFLNLAIERYEG